MVLRLFGFGNGYRTLGCQGVVVVVVLEFSGVERSGPTIVWREGSALAGCGGRGGASVVRVVRSSKGYGRLGAEGLPWATVAPRRCGWTSVGAVMWYRVAGGGCRRGATVYLGGVCRTRCGKKRLGCVVGLRKEIKFVIVESRNHLETS